MYMLTRFASRLATNVVQLPHASGHLSVSTILSLSARVVKRRVRYERLGQVLPGCTILCTKAKDVQVWGTLYAVFCGKCLEVGFEDHR